MCLMAIADLLTLAESFITVAFNTEQELEGLLLIS